MSVFASYWYQILNRLVEKLEIGLMPVEGALGITVDDTICIPDYLYCDWIYYFWT
jgi:hypothetical protein